MATRWPSRDGGVRIVIPHRGLAAGKTRLAGLLSPADRALLSSELLSRVLRVTQGVVDDVVLVSPDPALRCLANASGARFLLQLGQGLNQALDQARRAALRDRVSVLAAINADLPLIRASDVAALISAADDPDAGPRVVIAPDRHHLGTNAIVLSPPNAIRFRFGPGSLAAHRDEADRRGIRVTTVARPGLLLDLDTPADLETWGPADPGWIALDRAVGASGR